MRFDPLTWAWNAADRRDEKRRAKERRRQQWHFWFAWRPVVFDHPQCVWLETIARKRLKEGESSNKNCSTKWAYGPVTEVLKE